MWWFYVLQTIVSAAIAVGICWFFQKRKYEKIIAEQQQATEDRVANLLGWLRKSNNQFRKQADITVRLAEEFEVERQELIHDRDVRLEWYREMLRRSEGHIAELTVSLKAARSLNFKTLLKSVKLTDKDYEQGTAKRAVVYEIQPISA